MKPTRPRALIALALLPLAAGLVACGGNVASDDSGSKSVAASRPDTSEGDGLVGSGDFAAKPGEPAAPAAKPAADTVVTRSVIATGQLQLRSTHLDDVRQDAINLAMGLRGFVAEEQSQSDAHGKLDRVDLSLRVPAASFEKAFDALAALGTVRHRQQSVEDVTTQVIDTGARVRSQKASVASIQQLLARASSIAEIMSIESQLASRQADLDSLEQQQRYLADQTSLSTIQLTITSPTPAKPHHKAHHRATGFLAGLDGGWHALSGTAVVAGTALGALLPFAVVLALLGIPGWVWVRRRRTVVVVPPAEV
jgi:hypothetical protein